jgi:HEAT repeat protein
MSERKRPRLFSFGRDIELNNLDSWVEDPSERALLIQVIDAFLEVVRTRKVTPETLAPVVAAAGHPAENVRGVGITRLVVLAHYFPEALDALRDISHHPDDGVRLYACSSLANAPEDALPELLIRYLNDPAWEVRKAAANVCTTQRTGPLDALVRQRLATERDARVKVVLELARRFQAGHRS